MTPLLLLLYVLLAEHRWIYSAEFFVFRSIQQPVYGNLTTCTTKTFYVGIFNEKDQELACWPLRSEHIQWDGGVPPYIVGIYKSVTGGLYLETYQNEWAKDLIRHKPLRAVSLKFHVTLERLWTGLWTQLAGKGSTFKSSTLMVYWVLRGTLEWSMDPMSLAWSVQGMTGMRSVERRVSYSLYHAVWDRH